jgi:Domain of unknown function (DUF4424)
LPAGVREDIPEEPTLMRTIPIAAAFAVFAFGPAFADDSTAELATGGLAFVQTDDIEMQSEDLFVSMTEIRASYEFVNTSDHDVTTLVAFPRVKWT